MDNPETNTTKEIDAVAGEGQVNEDLERSLLLGRANQMGLRVGPGIGLDKLRAKVNAAVKSQPVPDDDEDDEEDGVDAAPVVQQKPKTLAEIKAELRMSIQAEQMALLRCRITNMHPDKRDLKGEILTVDNELLGSVRKFIPFDGSTNEKGYHVPRCLVTFMQEKVYTVKVPVKDRNGNIVEVQTRDMPEYAIQIMEPLTEAELKDLAYKQEAVSRLEGLS